MMDGFGVVMKIRLSQLLVELGVAKFFPLVLALDQTRR